MKALAHNWPRGHMSAFPPVSLIAQTLCKIREKENKSYWLHNLAPASRTLQSPCLVPGWDMEEFKGLSPAVIDTIIQAFCSLTKAKVYHVPWGYRSLLWFSKWCFVADICRAVGWATPNTFVGFYNLRVKCPVTVADSLSFIR